MKTYIAILRGINVSGQKSIKMSDLVTLCEKAGFSYVQTYIQSGNIIFQSELDAGRSGTALEKAIRKKYNFDVPVFVREYAEIKKILQQNPFIKRKESTDHLYYTFLSSIPQKKLVESIDAKKFLPEEFKSNKDVIYFFSPNGYGRAKMNNNFFEQKLKVKATTRNWKTVNKLAELAEAVRNG